jgi:hypothetical protein
MLLGFETIEVTCRDEIGCHASICTYRDTFLGIGHSYKILLRKVMNEYLLLQSCSCSIE